VPPAWRGIGGTPPDNASDPAGELAGGAGKGGVGEAPPPRCAKRSPDMRRAAASTHDAR